MAVHPVVCCADVARRFFGPILRLRSLTLGNLTSRRSRNPDQRITVRQGRVVVHEEDLSAGFKLPLNLLKTCVADPVSISSTKRERITEAAFNVEPKVKFDSRDVHRLPLRVTQPNRKLLIVHAGIVEESPNVRNGSKTDISPSSDDRANIAASEQLRRP
jgi:hypothetical protein